MSVYMTEEEQLDAIKKWWNRHQTLITVLLSIVLLIMAGHRYWHWHETKLTQQASSTYEQLMVSFSNQDKKAVRAYAHALLTDYKKTIYADGAQLILAKMDVSKGNYTAAKNKLSQLVSESTHPSLQQIASIRLARLFIEDKQYDQALNELNKLTNVAYAPIINELKGDVFLAKKDYQYAMDAYKTALAEAQTIGTTNLFLEMKVNDVAALTKTTQG